LTSARINKIKERLNIIFHIDEGLEAETKIFKDIDQKEIVESLKWWINKTDKIFGEINENFEMHSLNEEGIDFLMQFDKNIKIGFQIKPFSDFDKSIKGKKDDESFSGLVHKQKSMADKHGLLKYYLVFATDVTIVKHRSRMNYVISEISQEKRDYVSIITPQKVVKIYNAYISNTHPIKLIHIDNQSITEILLGLRESMLNNNTEDVKISIKKDYKKPNIDISKYPYTININTKTTDPKKIHWVDETETIHLHQESVHIGPEYEPEIITTNKITGETIRELVSDVYYIPTQSPDGNQSVAIISRLKKINKISLPPLNVYLQFKVLNLINDLFLFFKNKKYKDCIKLCDIILDYNPLNIVARMIKGMSYGYMGFYKLSDYEFSSCISINPQIPEFWYNRAITLLLQNQKKNALQSLDKACKLDKKNKAYIILYCFVKATLLENQKIFGAAKVQYEKVLNLDPKFILAKEGIARCLIAIGFKGEGILTIYNSSNNDISEYNKKINEMKDNPEPYYNKGVYLAYNGKIQESIVEFDNALNIDPKYINAKINKAESLRQLEDLESARKLIEEVLNDDNENINAIIILGLIQYSQKEFHNAEKNFNKALKINSKNVFILKLLIDLLMKNSTRYDEMINLCDQGLAILNDDKDFIIMKSYAYLKKEQFDQSLVICNYFESKINDDNNDINYIKACCKSMLSEYNEALDILEKIYDKIDKKLLDREEYFENLKSNPRFQKLLA
jgi:tetratricopeptide (TPR) repeat protein